MKKTKKRAVALMIALLLFLSILTFLGKIFETTAKAGGYEGWNQLNGKWYYYTSDVKQTGWLKDNGVWYYLDPQEDGAMVSENAIVIGDYWYYFTGSGRLIQNGWFKIRGGVWIDKWIKAYPSGALIVGWHQEGSNWYYLGFEMYEDGPWAIWLPNGEYTCYYFNKGGALHTKGGWFQKDLIGDPTWFYAYQGGLLKMGWLKSYNKWFYLNPQILTQGAYHIEAEDKYYYFDENGVCSTQAGWFQGEDSSGLMNWYYRLAGGELKTGWFTYSNKKYYLKPEMLTNGPHTINNEHHYFDENGIWYWSGPADYLP